MSNSIPPGIKRFRAAMVPMALFSFVGIGGGASFLEIIIHRGFANVFWLILFWVFLFFGVPYSVFWTQLCRWLFPAGVSQVGIYAHSFWGMRRFIKWEDVSKARKFTLGNLRWLRIYSSVDASVAWLPLFQSHPVEFRQEIQKFAPPDNPILPYLN